MEYGLKHPSLGAEFAKYLRDMVPQAVLANRLALRAVPKLRVPRISRGRRRVAGAPSRRSILRAARIAALVISVPATAAVVILAAVPVLRVLRPAIARRRRRRGLDDLEYRGRQGRNAAA